MNEMNKAVSSVNALLNHIDGFDKVPESVITSSLGQSLIPDESGKFPGESGYSVTYDVHFAAYLTSQYMEGMPSVTSASSESTSVAMRPGNMSAFRQYLRSASPILGAQSNVLNNVAIPDDRKYIRVNMNGDSDVDTDIG